MSLRDDPRLQPDGPPVTPGVPAFDPSEIIAAANQAIQTANTAQEAAVAVQANLDAIIADASALNVIAYGGDTAIPLGYRFSESGHCINVLDKGAKGDGTTDDLAKILAAYAAANDGDTLYFPARPFLLAGTTAKLDILKSVNLYFEPGAELIFNNKNAGFLRVGVSNVIVSNARVRCSDPAISRTNIPSICVYNGADNVVLDRPVSINSPGAGLCLVKCTNARIISPIVIGSLADGIHSSNGILSGASFTGPVVRAQISNPLCISNGDDQVSIVSYVPKGDVCSDIVITGVLAYNGTFAGVKLAGAQNCRVDGLIDGAKGNGALFVSKDTSYNTYGVTDCHVNMSLVGCVGASNQFAAWIGKNVVGGSYTIDVSGTTVGGGVLIGSGNNTAAEYLDGATVSARARNNKLAGITINGVKNLRSSYLISEYNGTRGITGGNINGLSCAQVDAYNNCVNYDPVTSNFFDNIYLDSPIDMQIGMVRSIDDRATTLATNLFRLAGAVRPQIGLYQSKYMVAGVATSQPLVQSGNTDVQLGRVVNSGSKTWTIPTVAAATAGTATTLTVSGCKVGDKVEVSFSSDLQGLILVGQVLTDGTVSIRPINPTSGSISGVAAGTVYASCSRT
jgi:hypothetical protein